MLAAGGRDESWCAACGAVDGSLELRVGEPPRRRFLRRRDPGGEEWLRDHGFLQVIDAWALPLVAAVSDAQCAATLEAALAGALGVAPGTPLRHVLTHPGILDGTDVPPPEAAIEAHLGAAGRALVRAGRGRFTAGSGRPEELRAFVWALDGRLRVEREAPGVAESPGESWDEPLTDAGAEAAAAELARRVRAGRPATDHEPWFVHHIPPNS